jgi:hypothetical protein
MNMTRIPSVLIPALLGLGLLAGPATTDAQMRVPVRVERVKPEKEKLPSLQFLKDNRDFLRSRIDELRQVPVVRDEAAADLDPRLLGYAEMLRELAANRDTLDAQRRHEDREFLASVTELGDLEAELDLLASLLDEQATRLGDLEADFLGRQRTAVVVLVKGVPGQTAPEALALTDSYGETVRVPISADALETLGRGGVLQIYHEFTEPRDQTWEVAVTGTDWVTDPAYLRFDPTRNRLSFLELDLATLDRKAGAASLTARAWVLSDAARVDEGSRPE